MRNTYTFLPFRREGTGAGLPLGDGGGGPSLSDVEETTVGVIGAVANIEDFVREYRNLGEATSSLGIALDRVGTFTDVASVAQDLQDILDNGLNVQNGVNFGVSVTGLGTGLAGGASTAVTGVRTCVPVLWAFCAGYGIGRLLVDLLGADDLVLSLIEAVAGGPREDNNASAVIQLQPLAEQGDLQAQRIIRMTRQLGFYEDRGAADVNEAFSSVFPGATSAYRYSPEDLRDRGRRAMIVDWIEENYGLDLDRETLMNAEIEDSLDAIGNNPSLANLQSESDLRDRLEEEQELLDRRIEEARQIADIERDMQERYVEALRELFEYWPHV